MNLAIVVSELANDAISLAGNQVQVPRKRTADSRQLVGSLECRASVSPLRPAHRIRTLSCRQELSRSGAADGGGHDPSTLELGVMSQANICGEHGGIHMSGSAADIVRRIAVAPSGSFCDQSSVCGQSSSSVHDEHHE